VNQLPRFFRRDSFVPPRLLAGSLNAGEQFDLPRDLFQRRVFWKLGDKFHDHFSAAHAEIIPDCSENATPRRLCHDLWNVVCAMQGLLGGLMFWGLRLSALLFRGVVMGLLAGVPVLGGFVFSWRTP
jgi:hypothetical protein